MLVFNALYGMTVGMGHCYILNEKRYEHQCVALMAQAAFSSVYNTRARIDA